MEDFGASPRRPEPIELDNPSVIGEFLRANMPPHSHAKRKELIDSLPALKQDDLEHLGKKDDCCPICFVQFSAVLANEETAIAMDSPAIATEDLGVTKLAGTCGHVFCRKDISTWIRQNDSCPTCRQPFITREQPEQPLSANVEPASFDEEELFWRVFQGAGLYISPMARPGRSTRVDVSVGNDDSGSSEFAGMYS